MSVFGLADHATETLDAYIYTEATGKKGGDNVCSLIFKKLKDGGLLEAARTGSIEKNSINF